MPFLRGLATSAIALTVLAAGCATNDNGNNTLAGRTSAPATAPGNPQSTGPAPNTGGEKVPLEAKDFAFEPKTLEVKAGDVVIEMKNTGVAPHTFTNEKDFGAPVDVNADGGKTVDVPLTGLKPGTYKYICKYHPQMTGELKVT